MSPSFFSCSIVRRVLSFGDRDVNAVQTVPLGSTVSPPWPPSCHRNILRSFPLLSDVQQSGLPMHILNVVSGVCFRTLRDLDANGPPWSEFIKSSFQ